MEVIEIMRKTPIYDKKEILEYIVKEKKEIVTYIHTHSGKTIRGYILNIGSQYKQNQSFQQQDQQLTRPYPKEKSVVIIQEINNSHFEKSSIIHVDLDMIEMIQFENSTDALDALSKGTVEKPTKYGSSSKLEVKRNFQHLSDEILKQSGIEISSLTMELPDDNRILNRIYVLTNIIKDVLSMILKEKDALESWREKYAHIVFIHKEKLSVNGVENRLEINFPFQSISAPEISKEELETLILTAL